MTDTKHRAASLQQQRYFRHEASRGFSATAALLQTRKHRAASLQQQRYFRHEASRSFSAIAALLV